MPKKPGPVEIAWSPLALARLQEIRAFVALDKPDAAERLATRIVSVVEALRIHPYLGRVGPEPGIRELIIGGTPYSILYRIRANRLVISTISHASQFRYAPTHSALFRRFPLSRPSSPATRHCFYGEGLRRRLLVFGANL